MFLAQNTMPASPALLALQRVVAQALDTGFQVRL